MLWLLILFVVIAWFVLRPPSWLPRPSRLRDDATGAFQRASNRVGATYADLTARLPFRRSSNARAINFREWITNQMVSPDTELYDKLPAQAQGMTAWLATLSDREMEAFREKVAHFTASLGLDLDWLLDNKVTAYPALKQAIQEAVALYSISAWRAYNVQQDVKAFRAYQAWLTNPSRHRALGQKLYSTLVAQGLAPTTPDLYLANDRARNAEAVRAIKEVAESKPEVVTAIVREFVTEPEPSALRALVQRVTTA